MSSVVCQGLQSCLEPQPRVLRHKLSLPPKSKISQPLPCPQKPNLSQEHQLEKNSRNENEGNGCDDSNLKSSKNDGWNFIQALTNSSPNNTKQLTNQTEKVYVHPLVKRSASALSSKSLEMCTESLGSETGSDISGEFSSLSWEREKMQLPNEEFTSISWEKKSINRSDCREIFTKKLNPSRSFPPPLTSFSGLDGGGVQVRPHREGGRLVIKALAVSPSHTNFQADRANGRLRLSLLKECSVNSEIIKEKKEEVYNEQEEGDKEVLDRRNSNDLIEEEEEEEEEEIDDDDDDEGYLGEEMEGNGGNIGSEIGNGELARPSRCKESGRGSEGMSSWGQFRVAIS